MEEDKKIKVIIISVMALLIIGIVFWISSIGGKDSSSDDISFDLNQKAESNFTVEDMMKHQDKNLFDKGLDPYAKTETESIDKLIEEAVGDTIKTDDFYGNEDDKLIAELQEEYKVKEENYKKTSSSSSNSRDNVKVIYRDRPVREKKEEEEPKKSNEIELDDYEFGGFGDSDAGSGRSGVLMNDVPAVIDENYKGAKQNQVIRIRTTKDCVISGAFVPANTIIEGITQFGERRVYIEIDGIDLGNNGFVNCSLEVRDRLKRKGLETKKNLAKELKKEGSQELAKGGNARVSTPLGGFSLEALKKKQQEPSVDLYENHKLYLRIKTR